MFTLINPEVKPQKQKHQRNICANQKCAEQTFLLIYAYQKNITHFLV